ncbi:efflux RND transporter permease subunit [Bacteroides stercoris]|jgi:multidrug efflux pump subunit AcrB|uniref:AcrB/AcrD/AcrF family protein n=1 Tax=Bacteroides stercoris TaxID=46506 RepID=A0A412DPX1_BACSE|nr:efflux RND transporter permease subunit [Bacteroides stercoris]MDC2314556.1 efflux RND transporter permease subunit [Bacteroides stercoris]MDC2317685.1 efflux RND transporter permease subunit [Bacteroides stercoris]MDC2320776.1 efflux RND transporter permease subunit [Bacteroides stercoris]MDC2323991.1 efflux RND transporter permease subunit [Bacteroides stercoris]MDC2327119.1 efflux RND transporter permease subunit [Bacteroides stercoris]
MKLVKYFLSKKPVTILLLVLVLAGGLLAYVKMGKLEDAPFTIKQALVLTPYPGASPSEVQSQVTDVLEESIQALGELYYLKTENRAGLSKITVYVKKETRADEMQQLWDKLRRKVNDVQSKLPEGAGPSVVNDDFGDVLGVFYGLTGNGHSYRELEDEAKLIKNEILKVKDVAKVEIYGTQTPTIDISVSPSVMARSGITMADIARAFEAQNKVVDAGGIDVGSNRLRIESTGNFYSLDDIRNLTIVSRTGEHFRLADITRIEESYQTPASNLMRINGQPAVGIAISTVPTGNVVDMAAAVKESLQQMSGSMPEGFELVTLYDQGYESAVANQGFILNLIISVLTVVAILLFFIGFKNGLLIGSGLVFSIFATLIVMLCTDIALQRMSLAAIIIAMGMLVDNAIVVSDSALVNMQRGMRKRIAIMRACSSTALPLLAATVIAILTFLPIYFSPHITGELLSSLVIVIGVSLMFSWVFALTQTPFFIQEFVRRPRPEELKSALFDGKYYNMFRRSLHWVIKHRYATIACMVLLLVLSAWSFKFIPKVFVPALDKQYFTVDVWLSEGSNIDETGKLAEEMAEYIRTHGEAEMVSTFIGRTPPRYYLSNVAFGPQSNYTQLLVKCHTSEESRRLNAALQDSIRLKFPGPLIKVNKFELSPLTEAVIEARFLGPDPAVLDSLVGQAIEIMRRNPKVADARNEWGNMALMLRPVYDPVKAGELGITKAQMMQSVKSISDGVPVGIYRDNEKKVPVLLKSEGYDITDAASLGNFSVWNGERSAPLSQVTERIETTWEFPQMRTYNRQLSMAAMCGVKPGHTMAEVHGEIRSEIEAMPLPPGYTFFWDSQYKDQGEAMEAIAKYFPLAFLMLIVILVALFGNFRQPIIILCILPLSLIGVAVGMLLTGFDFGFFPIAGWLGLLGMIIKNVIVLIDEINIQRREGVPAYTAVIESTVSRTRPVLMAATTTILGMVPLLFDIAFGGMAATIIFGLTFATLLTLFVTPALYILFYRIKINK